jgi:hypothetical protein
VEAFAVLVARIFDFARTFGLANPDAGMATKFYRDALADMPQDLLSRAVSDICREWKWGNKIPLPADLRNQVERELTQRKVDLSRLELVASRVVARSRQEPIAVQRNVSPLVTQAVKRVPVSSPDDEAAFQAARAKLLAEMAADPDFAEFVA